MKIKFKGLYETKSAGCGVCGRRRSVGKKFLTSKTYYLPSGTAMTFRINEIYDVVDKDGAFLLQYNYRNEHCEKINVFEAV